MDFWRKENITFMLERIKNEVIREQTEIQDNVKDWIKEKRLVWYGNVGMVGEERLEGFPLAEIKEKYARSRGCMEL